MELELLGSGRDADVYLTADATRVLRRNRSGRSTEHEVEFMRLAHSLGYPAPDVFSASGPDIVMERLHGTTMLNAALAGDLRIEAAAVTLADLHDRLHRLPIPDAPPGESLVHLDLHPDNVILTPEGPIVIDWTNARLGAPGLDTAMTALLFAIFATDPGSELAEVAEAFLTGFVRACADDPIGRLDVAIAMRSGDWNLTDAERERLPVARALIEARAAVQRGVA